jgi:hypothetical protein
MTYAEPSWQGRSAAYSSSMIPSCLGPARSAGSSFLADADIMQKFAGHACSEDASQSGRRIGSEGPEAQ